MALAIRGVPFLLVLALVTPRAQDPASQPSPQTQTRPAPQGRSPIAGWYVLKQVVRPRDPNTAGTRGYLVVGEHHLSIHLHGKSADPRFPLLQSGFRRYQLVGDKLVTTGLMGIANRPDGTVLVEGPGLVEERRCQQIGTLLRVYQGPDTYMDFERIE